VYEFFFGETALTGSGSATNELIALGVAAPKDRTVSNGGVRPNPNVGFTAAPNAALFDSAKYLMNSINVESNSSYYDTAAAQLVTKVDREGPDTMGSNMCNSKRLDYGRDLYASEQKADIKWDDAIGLAAAAGDVDDDLKGDFPLDEKDTTNANLTVRKLSKALVQQRPFQRGGSVNPKHEILAMGFDPSTGKVRCEVSEPLFLATHQHPYAIGPSDHQLFLQISRTWLKDLIYCCDYSYGCIHGDGGLISPMPSAGTDVLKMGQIYCSIKSVEYHAAFISPMVSSIPPSIGIKYSAMNIQRILLQSNIVNEQIVVPPSCRAVYVFLRQRYHHVCACREELGRGGVGFNEVVTSLPTKNVSTGQSDPRYQGRALPHNLQTLAQGTADGWIRYREGGLRTGETGGAGDNYKGARVWANGVPTDAFSTGAAPYDDTKNKLSNGDTTTAVVKLTGDDQAVTCPTIAEMEAEATTHWTDLQVQLGSAMAPKQPYTNLDPNRGLVSRMWTEPAPSTSRSTVGGRMKMARLRRVMALVA
jgi:hypothetical protein